MGNDAKRDEPRDVPSGSNHRRYGLFGVSAYPQKNGMEETRRRSMVRWAGAVVVLAAAAVVVLAALGSGSGGLTVTFDSQGGSAAALQSVPFGGLAEDPGEVVRPGYVLVGWSVTPDGSQPWDFGANTVTEAITLYAVWEREP